MRWGRVEVTAGFFLLLAWLNYCDAQRLLPMVLCAAALHEFGHCAAVYMARGRIALLRLSAVGAQLIMEGTLSYGREVICALAGPLCNICTAMAAACFGWESFAGINLVLGVFNLLPIRVLDGGRIVDCVSAILLGPENGSRVCEIVDTVFAAVVGVIGAALFCSNGSLTLLLVSIWLWTRGKKRE